MAAAPLSTATRRPWPRSRTFGPSHATPARAIRTGSWSPPKPKTERTKAAEVRRVALSPLFRQVSFDALPGWRTDDPSAAFEAFRRSAHQILVKPYKSGMLGVDFAA